MYNVCINIESVLTVHGHKFVLVTIALSLFCICTSHPTPCPSVVYTYTHVLFGPVLKRLHMKNAEYVLGVIIEGCSVCVCIQKQPKLRPFNFNVCFLFLP